MKIRFIVNPIAGGKNSPEAVTDAVLRVYGTASGIFEIKATRKKGDAYRFSKEAKENFYDTVFACGGDGTINEVASALVNSDTALAVLPVGSGNALASALGIPFDMEKALSIPLNGRIRAIDAGRAGDRLFFSTAGVGLDAVIAKKYDKMAQKSKIRGILPYLPLTVVGYFGYSTEPVLIKYNDTHMMTNPLFLTVANTAYYGAKAVIAPGAAPDDGLFDVCIVEKAGFFNALSFVRKLFNGDVRELKNYKRLKAGRIEILKKNPGVMHVDGEPAECGEKVVFEILPRALKVWTL